ncbi:hypothetical protein LEMLEM_LOCUS4223 [Lemmus lemmus]
MMRYSHAGGSEIIDAHRIREIAVNFAAMLNKCGVIQPRFNAQLRSLGKQQEKNSFPFISLAAFYWQPQLANINLLLPVSNL